MAQPSWLCPRTLRWMADDFDRMAADFEKRARYFRSCIGDDKYHPVDPAEAAKSDDSLARLHRMRAIAMRHKATRAETKRKARGEPHDGHVDRCVARRAALAAHDADTPAGGVWLTAEEVDRVLGWFALTPDLSTDDEDLPLVDKMRKARGGGT